MDKLRKTKFETDGSNSLILYMEEQRLRLLVQHVFNAAVKSA